MTDPLWDDWIAHLRASVTARPEVWTTQDQAGLLITVEVNVILVAISLFLVWLLVTGRVWTMGPKVVDIARKTWFFFLLLDTWLDTLVMSRNGWTAAGWLVATYAATRVARGILRRYATPWATKILRIVGPALMQRAHDRYPKLRRATTFTIRNVLYARLGEIAGRVIDPLKFVASEQVQESTSESDWLSRCDVDDFAYAPDGVYWRFDRADTRGRRFLVENSLVTEIQTCFDTPDGVYRAVHRKP